MPVCKAEAHRALELLEDFYSHLDDDDDEDDEVGLKESIEKVIKTFKAKLFQALLDIQQLYELTLMDEQKSNQLKAKEAMSMLAKWDSKGLPFPDPSVPQITSQEQWEMHNLTLHRSQSGFGFCIAGDLSTGIRVTKISDKSQPLMVNDVIMQIGDLDVANVKQNVAIEMLRSSGNSVQVLVKRRKDDLTQYARPGEELIEVLLLKNAKGLGFTIAGGIGNQHIPGDNGIYITKVMSGGAAAIDGRVKVGDRVVMVRHLPEDFLLEDCTHEQAVNVLKRNPDRVHLVLGAKKMAPPVRQVVLHKKDNGLGFNIVGGDEQEGIFVSYILPGGPADLNGQMRKGDKIMFVNGIDLRQATHEEAVVALKSDDQVARLTVLFSPDEFRNFETKILTLRNQSNRNSNGFFVRALFTHCPVKEGEISFNFGDILFVSNCTSHADWWQAKIFDPKTGKIKTGLIPNGSGVDKAKGRLGATGYEMVQEIDIDYAQPVIILGYLKDNLNDELISEYPDKFSSCIPHTTRPPRPYEVDGRDYYFVASRQQMERDIQENKFIEAGQYNGNLYGTSMSSVMDVAKSGKHCILDVSGYAIKRLQSAGLYPIAILVKPSEPIDIIRKSASDTEKMLNKLQKLENEFLLQFNFIITGSSFDDIYDQVKAVIVAQPRKTIWVAKTQT